MNRTQMMLTSAPRDSSLLVGEVRDERECPYCAELILKKARVCKHCGREVEPLTVGDGPVQSPSPAPAQGIPETQGSHPLPPKSEPVAVRPAETAIVPQFRLLSDRAHENLLPRQMDSGPKFRSISNPPGKMMYVALLAVALVLVIAGVLYFSHQATQPPAPARTTSAPASAPSTPDQSTQLGFRGLHAGQSRGEVESVLRAQNWTMNCEASKQDGSLGCKL